jgi:hypothetical protein
MEGEKGTQVDAQWLGNPTRFLNDSRPELPNCFAHGGYRTRSLSPFLLTNALEVVVNGERRIVIRACK